MTVATCGYVPRTAAAACGMHADHELDGRALCVEHLALVADERRAKARRRTYDPCPAGEPGVTDLGHGVRIRFTTHHGVTAGLIESHPRPDTGERCSGAITFDLVETVHLEHRARWRVITRDPLTLNPSVMCRTCGHHGWIRNGRWVPA